MSDDVEMYYNRYETYIPNYSCSRYSGPNSVPKEESESLDCGFVSTTGYFLVLYKSGQSYYVYNPQTNETFHLDASGNPITPPTEGPSLVDPSLGDSSNFVS